MDRFVDKTKSPEERRSEENLRADLEGTQAMIAYVAMMTDVDIYDEEEEDEQNV